MTDHSAPTRGEVTQGGAVDQIVRHIQTVMGPINTDTCEVEGDDDRSILLHNIGLIVERVRLATIEDCNQIALGYADMCEGSDDPHTVTAKHTAAAVAECIRNLGRGV